MARRGLVAGLTLALTAAACGGSADRPEVSVLGCDGGLETAALARAERRAYDGAPPVIPHRAFGVQCDRCHNARGMEVAGVGLAPPMPHAATGGMSATSRCVQCHVHRQTDGEYVESTFVGLEQDLREGRHVNELAPLVIPHPVFMREQCLACHSGPAAREEIRTNHPERVRCVQCHVARVTAAVYGDERF